MQDHKVTIETLGVGSNGLKYRTLYEGAVLVPRTKDPEYASCRALKDLGLTGGVSFHGGTGVKRSSIRDLVHAAGYTVDDQKSPLHVQKYTEPLKGGQTI